MKDVTPNKKNKISKGFLILMTTLTVCFAVTYTYFTINMKYQNHHIENNSGKILAKNPITLDLYVNKKEALRLYRESRIQYYGIYYLSEVISNKEELSRFVHNDVNPKDQVIFETLKSFYIASNMIGDEELIKYIDKRFEENNTLDKFNEYSWSIVYEYIKSGMSYKRMIN